MGKLAHIFSSVLGIDERIITDALSPANTPSWDSLNAIILITEIEKVFNVKFDFDEAMAVKNFADAVSLVKSKGVDPYE